MSAHKRLEYLKDIGVGGFLGSIWAFPDSVVRELFRGMSRSKRLLAAIVADNLVNLNNYVLGNF